MRNQNDVSDLGRYIESVRELEARRKAEAARKQAEREAQSRFREESYKSAVLSAIEAHRKKDAPVAVVTETIRMTDKEAYEKANEIWNAGKELDPAFQHYIDDDRVAGQLWRLRQAQEMIENLVPAPKKTPIRDGVVGPPVVVSGKRWHEIAKEKVTEKVTPVVIVREERPSPVRRKIEVVVVREEERER